MIPQLAGLAAIGLVCLAMTCLWCWSVDEAQAAWRRITERKRLETDTTNRNRCHLQKEANRWH